MLITIHIFSLGQNLQISISLKKCSYFDFFHLKVFHIFWAHRKCESSDLSFFNFALATLGLLAIPCEFDDQLFYVCKKRVEI